MSGSRTEATRAGRGAHPVNEVLPPGRLAIFGFQHVLAMYAGAVAVPLILATAIGLIPVASPTFYSAFPSGMQIVLNSGITAGSLTAIILNVAFNVMGGREERPDPTSVATARTSGETSGPV